jgi:tetratricopeptide (TPR) repeat protein
MRKHFCPLFLLTWFLCGTVWSQGVDLPHELHLAQDLENAGHYDEAMTIYRAVLQSEPQSLPANLGLGRACFYSHRYSEAADRFGLAQKLSPGNADVVEWLARSFLGSMEPRKAIDLLHREDAITGHAAWAHLLSARAFDALDELDDARSELARTLALDPQCRGAHFALGFIAWTIRDLATAEKEFDLELALDVHEYLAFYYLAEVLELEGRLDEAESVLNKMGSDGPQTYFLHFAWGKWQERKQNLSAAAAEYRAALKMDPKQSEAHYHLAVVLRKLGQNAQADEEFDRSRQLRAGMESGMAQGMGKMRPHIPDSDAPPMGN